MIDFLIIGGGMAGVSTAARVAGHGTTVLLESESALGYHASGRSAALYEAQYGEPATVALNLAARSYFDQQSLLSPRGFLCLAPKEDEEGFKEAHATFGGDILTPNEAREFVPILDLAHIGYAALSREAYDIDTDRMLQGFARQARDKGAEIVTNARVAGLTRLKTGWQITTPSRSYEARIIINAAGAWADGIARMAGLTPIGITPLRRSMARIPAPGGHQVQNWPMLMDAREAWYAKPDAGKLLVSPADADSQDPHDVWADDMVIAEGIARYQAFVTEEVNRVEHTWAGLRSFAPDKNLVIGPDPEDPSFFWMAGQGGYGIQSAPAYSQLAADLIFGRPSELDQKTLQAISPSRFDQNPARL